jgi:hypothetical protein
VLTALVDEHGVRGWANDLDALHARVTARFGRAELRRLVRADVAGLPGPVERKNGWQVAEWAGGRRRPGCSACSRGHVGRRGGARRPARLRGRAAGRPGGGAGGRRDRLPEAGHESGRRAVAVPRRGGARRQRPCAPRAPASSCPMPRSAGAPSSTGRCTCRGRGPTMLPGAPRRACRRTRPALRNPRWHGRCWSAPSRRVSRRRRRWLAEPGHPFVLAVATNEPLRAPTGRGPHQVGATRITAALPVARWVCRSVADGSTGLREYDWARVRRARWPVPGGDHRRVARRGVDDPTDLACSVVFAPAGTALALSAQVAGTRWASAGCCQIAKSAVGLVGDHWYFPGGQNGALRQSW